MVESLQENLPRSTQGGYIPRAIVFSVEIPRSQKKDQRRYSDRISQQTTDQEAVHVFLN